MSSQETFSSANVNPNQAGVQRQLLVTLSITAEDYLRVYQGMAKKVYAKDHHGRRVSFPVNILQPYVTHEGVHGSFAIHFDEDNRFKDIRRVV